MEKKFLEFIQRGTNFIKREEYTKAIDCFQSAIAINPNSSEAHFQLAESFYYNEQFEEAVFHYEKSSKLNSNDIDAFFQLGRVYFQLKDYARSMKNFQKAHSIDPSNERAIRALGIVCFKNASIEEGKQFFKQYFEKFPGDYQTKEWFINFLVDDNQIEDAIFFLKDFIGFDNQYQLTDYDQERYKFLLKYSELVSQKKRYQHLVSVFESLVLKYPDDITICSIYGTASVYLVVQLCQENRFEDAKEVIQSNISIKIKHCQLRTKDNDDDFFTLIPHISFDYADGFIASENIVNGITFLYWIYDKDPDLFWKTEDDIKLCSEFLRLTFEILNRIYPDSDYLSAYYENHLTTFRKGMVTPKIHILLAEILLHEPSLKEIALIELKRASEDIFADWENRASIAKLLIKHDLDLNFALSELNRISQLNPEKSETYYLCSIAFLKLGNTEKFFYSIKLGIEKDPTKIESFIDEIFKCVLESTSDFKLLMDSIIKIKSQLEHISYKFDNYPFIKSHFDFMTGIIYEKENDNFNAILSYETALHNNDKLFSVFPYLGNVLLKENKPIKASEYFLKGRSTTNQCSDIYKKCTEGLAILAISQTNWVEAFNYYDELMKLYPNNEDYYQKSLDCYQNIKYLVSTPVAISEEEIRIIEKEYDEWEKLIRRYIIERIPNYLTIINENEDLRKKIFDNRTNRFLGKNPSFSIDELNALEFFDVMDYQKVLKKHPSFSTVFRSTSTFNFNIDCINELRNILKHRRGMDRRGLDSSVFYHGKAALIWFNKIFEKNIRF